MRRICWIFIAPHIRAPEKTDRIYPSATLWALEEGFLAGRSVSLKLWRQNLRVLAPVAAMLFLFGIVQAFGMMQTAREANSVDIEKTSQALRESLRGHVDRIAGVASDNGYWDDAADAVYRRDPDIAFIRRTWGDSTADGTNYDGAFVIGPDGRTIFGLRDGKADAKPVEDRIGPALVKLAARPQVPGAGVGGIVLLDNIPTLIGIAQIRPTSDRPDLRLEMPAHLVFVKRLDGNLLRKTGRILNVNDLHISARPGAGMEVPVIDVEGKPLAWLIWTPANPGMTALRRSLPLIGAAMLGALLLSLVVAHQSARSVAELARQAMIDNLSGLPNRRALRGELSRRLEAQEHVALCLIDLDGFKFINDNYGHGVGDHLIKSCSQMLLELVGDSGFVARLGGDEFAFVLSGAGAWEQARVSADEVLARLGVPFRVGERTVLIGASVGLSQGYGDRIDAQELLRRADVAMYAAKRAGKMRVCVYDARLDQRQSRIHHIENELRNALITEDFRLAYQPLFDAGGGHVTSVEALLRWTSPTMGEMEPADFIPVAEESGLIDPLGRFILRKVCEETLGWGGMRVAVNVSAAQLRNPDFAEHVRVILHETRFPAARLELEITETYLISDPETAGKVLHDLRDLGVSVALDDFGTGYASIGFLRQFSFDKLKLDRSLVMDAESSDAARALLQASVAMARALNMEVAAEGVETRGQADLMRIAGCDQLQGWLFEKAMDAEQVAQMLREGRAVPTREAHS